MTLEEKFDNEIWWVLQKLHCLKNHSNKKGQTHFIVPARPAVDEPIDTAQQKALYKIEERGCIEIVRQEVMEANYGLNYIFHLNFLPKFDELYVEYKKKFNVEYSSGKLAEEIAKNAMSKFFKDNAKTVIPTEGIYYNKNTGTGYANNHRFKFKNDQPEYFVFAEMYEKIGTPILRKRVLELSGYKAQDDELKMLSKNIKRKPSMETSATYLINDLAKKMRKRTGLTKDQIANNNGDLTLVGKKLKNSPN